MAAQSTYKATSPRDGAPSPRAWRVQSVDRAVQLLYALAKSSPAESTAALLGERTGLNRATAWRILSTLETHGMVACDRSTGQWSVGIGVVEIARAAGPDAIIRSARGVLERLSLQTGETTALAVLDHGQLTYVHEVAVGSGTPSWVGSKPALHATSTGKAYLAMLDPSELSLRLEGELQRFTKNTITDIFELQLELERVRERGYAECQGEFDADTWGVSAPLLDESRHPVAVLSVWGPLTRVSPARFEALGALARDAARSLSWR